MAVGKDPCLQTWPGRRPTAIDTEIKSHASYEAQKDSQPTNRSATVDAVIDAAVWFDDLPDALALRGSAQTGLEHSSSIDAGFFGIGAKSDNTTKKSVFSRRIDVFCLTYGMSPFPQDILV